ncbi:hypothetical protein D3C72_2112590 [compost metagenome]
MEPDVYCRKAIASVSTFGAVHSDVPSRLRASHAIHSRRLSSGTSVESWPDIETRSAVASTAVAAESLAIDTSRGRERCRRTVLGGYAGTAITPAYRQPKNAAM